MKIEYFYYIYSAMTQAIGALIALVGVFIIFRIQIQRDRIRNAYAGIGRILLMHPSNSSREEIRKQAENSVKNRSFSNAEKMTALEREFKTLEDHENILKYTIDKGKIVIFSVSMLFLYYIIMLHTVGFDRAFRLRWLILGGIGTLGVLLKLISYLVNCIEPKRGKYL